MALRVRNEDMFGFEIKGMSQAETKEQKIKALEDHYKILEGLTNEALSDIETRISDLKYL